MGGEAIREIQPEALIAAREAHQADVVHSGRPGNGSERIG